MHQGYLVVLFQTYGRGLPPFGRLRTHRFYFFKGAAMNQKMKKFWKVVAFLETVVYNIDAGRNALYTRGTELAFKRYAIAPDTGSRLRAVFSLCFPQKWGIFYWRDTLFWGIIHGATNRYPIRKGVSLIDHPMHWNGAHECVEAVTLLCQIDSVGKGTLKQGILWTCDNSEMHYRFGRPSCLSARTHMVRFIPYGSLLRNVIHDRCHKWQ